MKIRELSMWVMAHMFVTTLVLVVMTVHDTSHDQQLDELRNQVELLEDAD